MELETQAPSVDSGKPVGDAVNAGIAVIDPDDEQVAPRAFTDLVAAAHLVLRTVEVTGTYTAHDAVSTVEQITAVLDRLITDHFGLYVGDFSADAAKAMVRAGDLLGQARTQLSTARNHLTLDNPPAATPTVAGAPATV